MPRLLLLFVLFTLSASYSQAQWNDTLIYLKLPERISAFEDLVGPLSDQQSTQIANHMLEMTDEVRFGNGERNLRQLRQQLRRDIVAILNEEQKSKLRSNSDPDRNAMSALLRDFPPRPRD